MTLFREKLTGMSILGRLNPAPVWIYFEEICRIPRISKNESRIRRYLLDFAGKNGLESREDGVGNILIIKPAFPGLEKKKTIVLQSHMDMVGEKNADHLHNWAIDPIIPVLKGEWVTASGTTLGADDGIGISAQLAILTDKNIKSGRIECLFTVDEESGMTGAINLESDFFKGKTLLNLDSEDEGIIYIGCAGGMETVGKMTYSPVPVQEGAVALEISVTGLHGGHSGDEIHKGYANSVKIITRLVTELSERFQSLLSNFDAGNLRNAIPREAFATIVAERKFKEQILSYVDVFQRAVSEEFAGQEKEISVIAREIRLPAVTIDRASQSDFLKAILCCPHGALAWSKDMDDLVETSTNLAIARIEPGNILSIITSQRSSVDQSKLEAASMVASCLEKAGAKVEQSNGYPGWKPNLSSEILQLARNSYVRLFGKEPLVRAIHAGLECGLIYEKIAGIDMISIGPTIRGAHTPEEMIEIESTVRFWDLLVDIVQNIPEAE